jgi:hypothetical protein
MREFIRNDEARDTMGSVLIACLIAAAVLVAMQTLDPLIAVIRQIILTQIQ